MHCLLIMVLQTADNIASNRRRKSKVWCPVKDLYPGQEPINFITGPDNPATMCTAYSGQTKNVNNVETQVIVSAQPNLSRLITHIHQYFTQ
jgi:hypothetical protein